MPDLPEEAEHKYGVAAAPRSAALGSVAIRVARALRSAGLHGFANWGKNVGLKKVFLTGGKQPTLSVSMQQKEILSKLMVEDRLLVKVVDDHAACTFDAVANVVLKA